jgi:hypothetical protein
MRHDTYNSLTAAVQDELWRLSHGLPGSDLWLMQNRSVVALSPGWPLPDDALTLIQAAMPLTDWLCSEHDGSRYTMPEAADLAVVWMINNGATVIADAEDMAAILAEQETIAAEQEAAWKLREEGEI